MANIKKIIKESEYFIHETKKNIVLKFFILVLILLIYFIYISNKYGLQNGFYVTLLTWSFFVFCTPIADAGFLLDFPIRLLFKIRMVYSEIIVWIIALILNLYSFYFNRQIYEKTHILKIFLYILTHPVPLYIVILLSMIGTFMSIYFGDEMVDVVNHNQREKYKKHKNKYRIILMLFIIFVTILIYKWILEKLGLSI